MTHLLSDGGPKYMYPILILLLITIFLIIRGIKNNSTKNLNLLKSIGLFSLVFGFLVFTIELISALDMISQANDIAPQVLAVGFKVGILPPVFGMFTFLVGRAGAIALIGMKKE